MLYLFNSFDFILFFAAVFVLYWALPKRFRNLALLAASYVFYASWNWKLLSLLLASTAINFIAGLGIHNAGSAAAKRAYLALAIISNLAMLGFFKYFNFFVENFVSLLEFVGISFDFTTLNIILPIGISFYTFQAMSYTIDIYHGRAAPTRKIIDFALFIAYFPQLIAGPIERARNLLPQIRADKRLKSIDYRRGAYLFVYGLFQKVVIADSVAIIVNSIYGLPNPTGAQVLIATYAFAVQIYADFSGYSKMARGISQFFGITLSTNFNLPYLAHSAADFWKRWHITLSSWVRDYVYIPLGGRHSVLYGASALFIAWLLMGLWHGAAWHFVAWGLYWAMIIFIYRLLSKLLRQLPLLHIKSKIAAVVAKIILVMIMFHLTVFGWVIFRAQTLQQAFAYAQSLFSGISLPELVSGSYWQLYAVAVFLVIYELLQYVKKDELFVCRKNFYYQMVFYLALFFYFVQIGAITNVEFIYFQF